jgi:hypothetical protein
MTRYRVRWTQVARSEPHLNAVKVLDRLDTLASTLEHFPLRGRVVLELARTGVRDWRD